MGLDHPQHQIWLSPEAVPWRRRKSRELPALQGRQGTAAVAMVKALAARRFEVRGAIERGSSKEHRQSPDPVASAARRGAAVFPIAFEPRASRAALSLANQLRAGAQQVAPDQRWWHAGIGPAGIVPSRCVTICERWLRGKGKRRVRRRCAQSSTASCSPSQRPGGPGVGLHLHRLPGPGGSRSSCLGQHAGKEFGRCWEDRQQRPEGSEAGPGRSALGIERTVRCVRLFACRARSSWRRFSRQ